MKNKYTGDLFGIELVKCPNCDGVGEINETPAYGDGAAETWVSFSAKMGVSSGTNGT